MEEFKQYASEMLELVNVMLSDAPLDTKRYRTNSNLGVMDTKTKAILLITDANIGSIAEVVQFKMQENQLEPAILRIGYNEIERTKETIIYEYSGNGILPSSIILGHEGKGICNIELYTKKRIKVLTPIKVVLEKILK